MQRTWFRVVTAVIAVAGVLTGIAAIALFYTDTRFNLAIASASFVPLLFVAVGVGALLALIGRHRTLLGLSVVILGVGAFSYAPLYVADAAGEDAEGTAIKVMQANLMVGQADSQVVVDLAAENDIDVLTIQELTDESVERLRASGIGEVFPYSYLRPYASGGGGAGIYSRLPLSESRELPGYGPVNLSTEMDVGDESVTVLAVHPGPAYVTPPDIWTAELDTLRTDLEAVVDSGPVIVSGDFNTTYSHRKFRALLDAGYSDAAGQVGTGLVPTYPTDKGFPALVGIDHILTNDGTARSLERIELPGSDHHGLIAEIVFPRTIS